MKADVKKYLVYNQLFSLIFTGSKKLAQKIDCLSTTNLINLKSIP